MWHPPLKEKGICSKRQKQFVDYPGPLPPLQHQRYHCRGGLPTAPAAPSGHVDGGSQGWHGAFLPFTSRVISLWQGDCASSSQHCGAGGGPGPCWLFPAAAPVPCSCSCDLLLGSVTCSCSCYLLLLLIAPATWSCSLVLLLRAAPVLACSCSCSCDLLL